MKYKERRIELEKEIQELMKKGLEYSEDPFKENLWNVFQDINAFMPAVYLTGDWFVKLWENIKWATDSAEETNNRMKPIKEAGYFNFDEEAARMEAFRVELWDFVKWNVLTWFKELNDLIEKNKDSIKKLAADAIKFFIDKAKQMVEWVWKNKEEIMNFWKESKKVWEEFKKTVWEVWEVMWPIMENMWNSFKKLSPEMKAAIVTGLLFHNTIFWVVWIVWTLIKSLPLLASPLWIIATWFLLAAWAAWMYSFNISNIRREQEKLNKEYNNMNFDEKNDIAWITNRLSNLDKEILEFEWWDTVAWRMARKIWMRDEEKVVLQKLKDQRSTLVSLLYKKQTSLREKERMQKEQEVKNQTIVEKPSTDYLNKDKLKIEEQQQAVSNYLSSYNKTKWEVDSYLLKELSSWSSNNITNVINQTIQGTVVTQNQVNAATNKATQTYNVKNGLNAQK